MEFRFKIKIKLTCKKFQAIYNLRTSFKIIHNKIIKKSSKF